MLRPRQNGCPHFADISKLIFFHQNCFILISISLHFCLIKYNPSVGSDNGFAPSRRRVSMSLTGTGTERRVNGWTDADDANEPSIREPGTLKAKIVEISEFISKISNSACEKCHSCGAIRTQVQFFLAKLSVISAFQIARFMGPTWGPPGSCRPQMGPMLVPWTLLLGMLTCRRNIMDILSPLPVLCERTPLVVSLSKDRLCKALTFLFGVYLNTLLNKQWSGRWSDTHQISLHVVPQKLVMDHPAWNPLSLWLPAWWALWLPWWPPAGCNNALMYLLIVTMNFCYCLLLCSVGNKTYYYYTCTTTTTWTYNWKGHA